MMAPTPEIIKKNKRIYILSSIFYYIAILSFNGIIQQTFLYSIGFSKTQIYIHSTIMQAVSMGVLLLLSGFADKSILKRFFICTFIFGLSYGAYIPLCFIDTAKSFAFILLISTVIIQAVTDSLYTVCSYKIPYLIFPPNDYGMVTAIIGIITSAISFSIGFVMTALSGVFTYREMMPLIFVISGIFMVVASLLNKSFVIIYEDIGDKKEKQVNIFSVFKEPVFYLLAPANIMRGFTMGVINVLAVIAADDLQYSAQITTSMVSVQALAVVLSCLVFGVTSAKINPKHHIFIGSLSTLILPLLLINDAPYLFIVLYFFIMFGKTFVDYGIPASLRYAVRSNIAGPYNAWRMAFTYFGSILATTTGVLVSTKALIIAAVALQLIAGSMYFFNRFMKISSYLD